MKRLLLTLMFALMSVASPKILAQEVSVSDAWVRATVPGQSGTGAFMTLKSSTNARLVGVKAHVAGVAAVHEMVSNGSVMSMRPIAALELPAEKAVVLTPNGLHIMLQDLHHPLLSGEHVQLVLSIESAGGETRQQFVDALVRANAP